MELPGKVIGCHIEEGGEEMCESCNGVFYESQICMNVRDGEDYQLIYAKSDTEQVTVFMTISSGIVDKLLVLDTPELADEHMKRFLEVHGYTELDDYALDEMSGHLKTEFKVFTREIQFEVEE